MDMKEMQKYSAEFVWQFLKSIQGMKLYFVIEIFQVHPLNYVRKKVFLLISPKNSQNSKWVQQGSVTFLF